MSTLRANKLIRQGCSSYLVNVMVWGHAKSSKTIDSVEVVREFVDVFLMDLLGLLLDRDAQFTMELYLRT